MTTSAIAMKGLLVSQRYQLGADFQLDLWNRRQELWLRFCSRVTITARSYPSCGRVFLEKLGRQRCCPVRGPRRFERRMFGSFDARLSNVVTFDALDFRPLDTAILY